MDLGNYNTTVASTIDSAEKYDEQTFYIRIPAIIYLSILMPIGILGNFSVIYIYGFCLKKSNIQFFITFLAFFDIMASLIGISLEMIELIHIYTYPSGFLCKIQRLINYTCNIGSPLVLLSISVERYIKVCRPMHAQMTLTHCRTLALGILIVSVPLAAPIGISYDRLSANVKGNITVYECGLQFSRTIFVYYSCFLPVCIANFITMFVLYACVLRAARRHFRQQETRHKVTKPEPSRQKISRTSMSVFCLTVVYAMSFTPTLIIGIVTKFYSNVDQPPALQATLILLYRSWAVNCSVNPIIYGVFNKAYRDIIFQIMGNILCFHSPKKRTSKEFPTISAIDTSI